MSNNEYRRWFRDIGQTIPPADKATKDELKMLETWGRDAVASVVEEAMEEKEDVIHELEDDVKKLERKVGNIENRLENEVEDLKTEISALNAKLAKTGFCP